MLVLSRKDGEQLCFVSDENVKMVTVRVTDDGVKLYRGRFILGYLDFIDDKTIICPTGVDVIVKLTKYRACDDVTLGFEADRDEVRIVRAECL